MWVDNGAESPIADRLTTGDLKYCESISSIIRSDEIEALVDGAGVFDGSKGLSDDVVTITMGDTKTRLLAIFMDVWVFAFFYP